MTRLATVLLALALPLLVPAAEPAAPSDLEAVVATSLGTFRFAFAPEQAPRHVEHFIELARRGVFDGSAFFRMVADGVIQGGDPLLKDPATPRAAWGTGGFDQPLAVESPLKHERGAVSAIRLPGKPDREGSQFFVCLAAQPALDGQYQVFGRVTEGLDVVDKISRVALGTDGAAEKPVRISSVTIEKRKPEPFAGATTAGLRRTVTLKTTLGTLQIAMAPEWAPETVRAFLKLVSTGWYDGTVFHRIAKGFVAQGGMPDRRTSGPYHAADGWVHPLKAEFRAEVKHVRGVVSLAHGDDPDSGTTSFFLVLGGAENLDGEFSAFGRVVKGLDVLDAFETEEVDGESPKRRIEIIEASVDAE
jgi:cyclophilin family peptidyl-prolyl cis-trans isomerase